MYLWSLIEIHFCESCLEIAFLRYLQTYQFSRFSLILVCHPALTDFFPNVTEFLGFSLMSFNYSRNSFTSKAWLSHINAKGVFLLYLLTNSDFEVFTSILKALKKLVEPFLTKSFSNRMSYFSNSEFLKFYLNVFNRMFFIKKIEFKQFW